MSAHTALAQWEREPVGFPGESFVKIETTKSSKNLNGLANIIVIIIVTP